jgi:hypothetical protein
LQTPPPAKAGRNRSLVLGRTAPAKIASSPRYYTAFLSRPLVVLRLSEAIVFIRDIEIRKSFVALGDKCETAASCRHNEKES